MINFLFGLALGFIIEWLYVHWFILIPKNLEIDKLTSYISDLLQEKDSKFGPAICGNLPRKDKN
jgi:hypothetical protein